MIPAMKEILWSMPCVLVFFDTRRFKRSGNRVGNPFYAVSTGMTDQSEFCFKELTEESAEDRPAVQKGDPSWKNFCLKLAWK